MLSLVNTCASVVLVSHWMACIWYVVALCNDCDGVDRTGTWIDATFGEEREQSLYNLYVASWYFAVMTMTTIGYGDIAPTNAMEEIVASIFMLIGALFYAYVITTVTEAMAALHKEQQRYREIMDDLNAFMDRQGLNRTLRVVTRKYIRTTLASDAEDISGVLALLSPDIQESIAAEVHGDWAKESFYFSGSGAEFVSKMAVHFVPADFPAGETILNVGQDVLEFYVLETGMVWDTYRIRRGCRKKRPILAEHAMLGKWGVQGEGRSSHQVLSLTHCSTYRITRDKVAMIFEQHPEEYERVKKEALRHAFGTHMRAYAQALLQYADKPLLRNFRVDEGLQEHYFNKIVTLKYYKDAEIAVSTLQRCWRGYASRETLAMRTRKGAAGRRKRAKIDTSFNKVQSSESAVQAMRDELYKYRKEARTDAVEAEEHQEEVGILLEHVLRLAGRNSEAIRRQEAALERIQNHLGIPIPKEEIKPVFPSVRFKRTPRGNSPPEGSPPKSPSGGKLDPIKPAGKLPALEVFAPKPSPPVESPAEGSPPISLQTPAHQVVVDEYGAPIALFNRDDADGAPDSPTQ